MSNFIENPSSIPEFKQNVDFQMGNVQGWVSANDYQSALIKAKCLVNALQAIVTAEESEQVERTLYENVKDFRSQNGVGLGPEHSL